MLGEPNKVHRGATTLPQTTQSALFRVTGRCHVKIIGEVTTAIQAQANATKLVANPTSLADVDLCATLDINGDAVGTNYSETGDVSQAMVESTSGVIETSPTANTNMPVVVPEGTIDLSCAASNTGAIKWTVLYWPIDIGAYVHIA